MQKITWKYIFLSLEIFLFLWAKLNPLASYWSQCEEVPRNGTLLLRFLSPLFPQTFRIKIVPLKPVRVYCLVHRLSSHVCVCFGWAWCVCLALAWQRLLYPIIVVINDLNDLLVILMLISLNKLEFVFTDRFSSDNTQKILKESCNLTWVCWKLSLLLALETAFKYILRGQNYWDSGKCHCWNPSRHCWNWESNDLHTQYKLVCCTES